MELKPFHESVIYSLKDAMKNYRDYMNPGGSQSVNLLIKELSALVNLIKNTKIPSDKLDSFVFAVGTFFEDSIDEVELSLCEVVDLEPMELMRESLMENLRSR